MFRIIIMATREEKVSMKQERSLRRIQKRQEKDREKISSNRDLFETGGFSNVKRKNGTWWEDGKLMQICDYFGTCEFPCNGDC